MGCWCLVVVEREGDGLFHGKGDVGGDGHF